MLYVKRIRNVVQSAFCLIVLIWAPMTVSGQISDNVVSVDYSGYKIPIVNPSNGWIDRCPNTPLSQTEDANGCSRGQLDSDIDGVSDADDLCVNSLVGLDPPVVDSNGCSSAQRDILNAQDEDGDGTPDYLDHCPGTTSVQYSQVDTEGCHPDQRDADGDSVPDYLDAYPLQHNSMCPAG